MSLLRLTEIEAGYRDLVAVRDVSLEVRPGEAVALIGSNGAGKTTTLRAIIGLLPLRAGRIEFEGARLDGLRSAQIVARGIAHVPEGRQLFPTLTVRDNLELGARAAHGRARSRLRPFPAAARARAAAGRNPLGRRAADVRDRARAHGAATPALARRAEPGAGAGDGEAHLRDAPARQRRRHHDHARRAERPARASALAPGLRARERAPHARGHAGRVARELPRQAGLPRALRRRPRKGGARLTRTRRARYVLGPPNMEKTVNRISALARHESAT